MAVVLQLLPDSVVAVAAGVPGWPELKAAVQNNNILKGLGLIKYLLQQLAVSPNSFIKRQETVRFLFSCRTGPSCRWKCFRVSCS